MLSVKFIGKNIQERIARRFSLKNYEEIQESMRLAPVVYPVTNVDPLMVIPYIDTATKDLSAGAGTFVAYFTVPQGKRWHVRYYARGGTVAATTIVLKDTGSNVINLAAAGTGGAYVHIYGGLPLEQGWSIGMNTTGNGADSAIVMQIHYEEEDAHLY